jgi:hypothetical protein
MARKALFATCMGILLLSLGLLERPGFRGYSTASTTPGPPAGPCRTNSCPTVTPTPTPTPNDPANCPKATAEPFWVEPVISPTRHLTQTIVVFLGNGEAVTVTCESGTYSYHGAFDAYHTPARVVINLLPHAFHRLEVTGKVRITGGYNGCIYGGYALRTTRDRYGDPLLIEQRPLEPAVWLPLVLKAQP